MVADGRKDLIRNVEMRLEGIYGKEGSLRASDKQKMKV